MLNPFCGFRRAGGIEEYIEFEKPLCSGYSLVVLGTDIAISEVWGNLASKEVIDRWVEHVLASRVFAAVAGPPLRDLERYEVAAWRYPTAP